MLVAFSLAACGGGPGSTASDGYPDQKLKELKPGNQGVVLAWRKGSVPVDDKANDISLGQTLLVRMRNLDGWLITKLLDNRITGEPDMTPAQRNNYALLDRISKTKAARSQSLSATKQRNSQRLLAVRHLVMRRRRRLSIRFRPA